VYANTLQAVKWFFNKGCPLVILACNTASAKALRTIQQNDLPKMSGNKRVLGVIRPTAEVIDQYTTTKHIGILGTPGTVNSSSYLLEIGKFFPELNVIQNACTNWVKLIEDHTEDASIVEEDVKNELNKILKKDDELDVLLLACTHYPLLLDVIEKQLPTHIKVISQGDIVANKLVEYLDRHLEIKQLLAKNSKIEFYTTGNTQEFNKQASLFYEEKVEAINVEINLL
jgi:glutamate racemase